MQRVLSLVLLFLAAAHTPAADPHLYLAAGDELTVFELAADSGEPRPIQQLALPGAGPFARSSDGQWLYAVAGTTAKPLLATLGIQRDGRLILRHVAPVNLPAGYLSVDATDAVVVGSHYGTGTVSIWKLEAGVFRGETLQELLLEPKAHSAVFAPDFRWLLVPATGPNKVFINHFDPKTGRLAPHQPPFTAGPEAAGQARQPRHLIFHPNRQIVYTTNERDLPGVGIWQWNPERGTLAQLEDIVTQPGDFNGVITTADLHLTPDSRFLYLSNRDLTKRTAPTRHDSIVGFAVNSQTGRLTMIGHTPCERHPRSFAIAPSGRFLYVAGQVDSRLGSYRINPASGSLTRIDQQPVGARPSWVAVF